MFQKAKCQKTFDFAEEVPRFDPKRAAYQKVYAKFLANEYLLCYPLRVEAGYSR